LRGRYNRAIRIFVNDHEAAREMLWPDSEGREFSALMGRVPSVEHLLALRWLDETIKRILRHP